MSVGFEPFTEEPQVLSPPATQAPAAPLIYKAVVAVKREAPAVGKNSEMSVSRGGPSVAYRSADDVMNAIFPLLSKHGISIGSRIISEQEGKGGRDNKASVNKIVKEYTFFAEDGSSISCSAAGVGQDFGDKAIIKAQTVALRIALCETFSIPFEDMQDPEAGNQISNEDAPAKVDSVKLLRNKLEVMSDPKLLKSAFEWTLKGVRGENDTFTTITQDDITGLLPLFDQAGRQCGLDDRARFIYDNALRTSVGIATGEAPVTETPDDIKVEALTEEDIRNALKSASDQESVEKAVCDLVRSHFNGELTAEQFEDIISTEIDPGTTIPASYILLQICCSSDVHSLGTTTSVLTQARQEGKIGKDVHLFLIQYLQSRQKQVKS